MLRPGPDIAPLHFYKLAGTVKDADQNPLHRKVRAFDSKSSARFYTWTDPATGAWEIPNIPGDRVYFVTAHDHTQELNMQAVDYVRAVPME